MYKHIFATLTFVTLASSLTAGGCSSSSSSGGGTQALDGADCHKITVDPAYPSQKCNNADDRCYMLDHNTDVRKWGGICATTAEGTTVPGTTTAKGCFSAANLANPDSPTAKACTVACLTAALTETTGGTVSNPCAECTAAAVTCGARYCAAECIQDSTSPGCTACICADHTDAGAQVGNCIQDAFAACAGFRPTNAQAGCP